MSSAARSATAEWCTLPASSFVVLQVPRPSPTSSAFRGEVVARDLDDRVALARMRSAPGRMVPPRGTRRNAPDTVLLTIQREGALRVTHDDRVVRVRAGEAVLYRGRRVRALECENGSSSLTIQVQAHRGDLDETAVTAALARPIPAHTPALRVLAAMAGELAATVDDLDVGTAPRMSSAVLDVLDALLGSLSRTRAAASGPVALAALAQRLLLESLGEQRLSVDTVARRFRVSRRYLTRAFAEAGYPAPASFLREERLRRATRLLEHDPRLTVASVASRCGFADVATFNRAFRRRYGASPRAWAAKKMP